MGADAAAIPVAIGKRKHRGAKRIGGSYSRIALGDIDGRLREAKLMRDLIEDLTAHCGGNPSAVQRQLIQRAAILHLRLALMDDGTKAGIGMTEKTAREYLCWNNAYCRTLRLLGLRGTPARASLAQIIAAAPARELERPSERSPLPDALAD